MADKKDFKFTDIFKFLDLTNDLEQIPTGKENDEEHRNDSRLNKVITGEARPAGHVGKEAAAWATTNVGIPLLTAGIGKLISGGSKAGSAGAKALSKVDDVADAVEAASKTKKVANASGKEVKAMVKGAKQEAKQVAKEGLKELDEVGNIDKGLKKGKFVAASEKDKSKVLKEAKKEIKEAEKAGKVLHSSDPIANAVQKVDKEDVTKSLDDLYQKYYQQYKTRNNKGKLRRPEEIEKLIKADPEYNKEAYKIINKYFDKTASKYSTVKGIEAGASSLLLPNFLQMQMKKDNGGDFAKDYLPKAFDKDIEIGVGKAMWNNLLNFLDLDGDDPDKYPMDKVNALLSAINDTEDGLGRYWNPKQIAGLSDQEKINLIKMISNHKFDNMDHLSKDTGKTPGYELQKAYKALLTNKEEESK